MRINIISHDNGVGLSQDMALLESFLRSRGHATTRVEWKQPSPLADVNIYLELFHERHLNTAPKHVGIFNLEWFLVEWEGHLRNLTQLWAKSDEAHQWFLRRDLPSTLTGFLSRDLFDETRSRRHRCLHVRGRSSQKGTEAVISAWRKYGSALPELIVVSHKISDFSPMPNVRFVQGPVSDFRLARFMNRCRFHVCPSEVEGWGHYLVEGLSCGGVIVTTDASPMNEYVSDQHGVLLKPSVVREERYVTRNFVDDEAIASAVMQLAALPAGRLQEMGTRARQSYLRQQDRFCTIADRLLRVLLVS